MSVFGKLFGSSHGKGGKAPTAQEALQRLKETEEMLTKKQEFVESKIDKEVALVKKHATNNKRVALQALKRKKRLEKMLAQLDGTLSNIEFQRDTLEGAEVNTEVLKTMDMAAKAMKIANMDIDKVEDLMADITEQQDLAQEISDVLTRPVFGEDYDEDELMAELEELEQEELDDSLLEISGIEDVPLPSVTSSSLPSTPAKKKEEEDEDDTAELEAWATN